MRFLRSLLLYFAASCLVVTLLSLHQVAAFTTGKTRVLGLPGFTLGAGRFSGRQNVKYSSPPGLLHLLGNKNRADFSGLRKRHHSNIEVIPRASGLSSGEVDKMVTKLVLLRHGESTWNKENRFTGWANVPLSETGKNEAVMAGEALKNAGYSFDVVYTSMLNRALETTVSVLRELDQLYLPMKKTWRLNERHYGALQGLNKAETAVKHGEDQVKIWRRSYDIPPPALSQDDERWSGNEVAYKGIPKDCCPLTECLKDTVERVLPYWFDEIFPNLLAGKKVLISAHGNSLRALIKYLDKMSDEAVIDLNVPTGAPLVYELDSTTLEPLRHYYLLDENELKPSMKIDVDFLNDRPVDKVFKFSDTNPFYSEDACFDFDTWNQFLGTENNAI